MLEVPIEVVLFVFLIIIAVVIQRQRDLFAAAMLTGIFSLLSASIFTLMDAVDVAFTEAAVGAGISTVLILATLGLTSAQEKSSSNFKAGPFVVVMVMGAALFYGTFDMPVYGDPNAPIHQHLVDRYINTSQIEIGLPNFVTSILASYRGFDTFGELAVVFTAGIGVTLVLGARKRGIGGIEHSSVPVGKHRAVRDMPVLRATTKVMIPWILLFAFYVQAHGDYGPGGGFQAGVILAAGFIAYGMLFGPSDLERVTPRKRVEQAIAFGLLLYGGVGIVSMIRGGEFLAYSMLDPHDPQHGQHLGILIIELGVGITVAAVMLTIYFQFSAPRLAQQLALGQSAAPPPMEEKS